MAYVSQDIPAVAKQIGLKAVDSGANVTLIQPYDDGVMGNSQRIGGVQTITPVQAYLD